MKHRIAHKTIIEQNVKWDQDAYDNDPSYDHPYFDYMSSVDMCDECAFTDAYRSFGFDVDDTYVTIDMSRADDLITFCRNITLMYEHHDMIRDCNDYDTAPADVALTAIDYIRNHVE